MNLGVKVALKIPFPVRISFKNYYLQTVMDFEADMKAILRAEPRYAAGVDRGIMPEGYLEAPLAYDAIWAVALGNKL